MLGSLCSVTRFVASGAVIGIFAANSLAGTILKLSPGSAPSHIEFGAGVLSTLDDGVTGTTGEQNTAVDFQGFLSYIPDIAPSNASVTLNGINSVGSATVFPGGLMMQNFTGGTVALYDATNTLLLSGSLNASTLAGAVGPPGTNALFTTSFNMVTGGTLSNLVGPGSVALKMNISDVNGGAGFSVGPANALNTFTADALFTLTGEQIPEPTASLLLVIGIGLGGFGIRRWRC